MGDKGKRDKGKREQQKKGMLSPKEKRLQKKTKNEKDKKISVSLFSEATDKEKKKR